MREAIAPTVTYAFQVEGMHCASCGLLIDDALEDLDGVKRAQTSVRSCISTVELDPARCTPDDILAAVAALGYTATMQG